MSPALKSRAAILLIVGLFAGSILGPVSPIAVPEAGVSVEEHARRVALARTA